MKQCINPVIRAHLVRGAFCLIMLLAVCVIPFALGQRATTKQSAVAGPQLLKSEPVATLSTGDDPAGGPGLSLAASTQHAIFTRRLCCPTAWSLLQGDR